MRSLHSDSDSFRRSLNGLRGVNSTSVVVVKPAVKQLIQSRTALTDCFHLVSTRRESLPLSRKARCLFDRPRIAFRSVTSQLTVVSLALEAALLLEIPASLFFTITVGDDKAPPAGADGNDEVGFSGFCVVDNTASSARSGPTEAEAAAEDEGTASRGLDDGCSISISSLMV